MKYTVEWTPPAEDELIALWAASTDQALLTLVIHQLEQRLRLDPYRIGRRRQSSVNRVVLSSPIGMSFEIIEDDKKVLILAIWSIP